MTSRLSSLLVRDGVIGVKRMEKAFQRQVLFGGALDTILLEMKEISEQRLVQYLSLATGLPPATARELDATDPRAIEVCPREAAEQFQVVPLSFEGDALRVLARDPVDLGALEDLASELGVPVQPFVAPEFRFELAFDRAYGRKSDARFTRIADMVKSEAPSTPVGRSQSVVVEASALASGTGTTPVVTSAPAPAPAGEPSSRSTLLFSGVAVQQQIERRLGPPVPDGVVSSAIDADLTPPEITMELPEELGGGVVERVGPHDTQRIPFTPEDSRASEIASGEIQDEEIAAAARRSARAAAVRPTRSVETAPLTPAEAHALLEQ